MTPRVHRSTWILPLTFACLVGLFGWWGTGRLRQTMEGQLQAELTATLEANATALEIWMGNEGRIATALAEDATVRDLALKVIQRAELLPSDQRRQVSIPELEELTNHLRPRLAKLGYPVAHLVATNYLMLSTSMRGRPRAWSAVYEEHLDKFSELFASGKPVIITPFRPKRPRLEVGPGFGRPPRDQESMRPPNGPGPAGALAASPGFGPPPGSGPGPGPGPGFGDRPPGDPPGPGRFRMGDLTLMQVATPLRDEAGVIRGALALIINPEAEFTRILSVARSGESGETYALDQHGMMLSRSRFDDQLRSLGLLENREGSSSALNLRLSDPGIDFPTKIEKESDTNAVRSLTHIAARAVAGTNGVDVIPARDYRGVPVIGAWKWLPQYGFGVATQVDASEAYRPLRVLKWLFMMLFVLLLLCTISLFLFSYLNLLWRRRLNEAELRVKQLGQYRLEEKIGQGGMGTVYRARHSLMRRETAVKLLLPNRADPEAEARFEKEVCLTCQLTHPNTIQVYDYGHTPEGIFYYAMELLTGVNLAQLIEQHGPQPEGRVIHILRQICDSLAEAHALGLIHRDIKPANIFLCDRGGIPDCVKVLDFGLVHEFRSSSEGSSEPGRSGLGTPLFMPPEAVTNANESDPRSDIYSLGALAYYLLTAEFVFEASTTEELLRKHQHEPPVPPSRRVQLAIPVSEALESLVMSCLEKDREKRPPSVVEVRSWLERSPHAADWTLEARCEWWKRNPLNARKPLITLPRSPDSVDATVKIDFSERTPAPSRETV